MPTENVCTSIAGEPFGPDVPGRDEAVAIEQENGVILHAFDQQSKPLLTLPDGLLLDPFPESIQINEDRNLGFQNLRHDRFDEIIHRATRESTNHVSIQGVDTRQEDNRRITRPLPLSD